MIQNLSYVEIEHKFILDAAFRISREQLEERIWELNPIQEKNITSQDVYYVLKHLDGHIIRYRFDSEKHELSIKAQDLQNAGLKSDMRLEVSLNLERNQSNSSEAVEAFLRPFGILGSAVISKRNQIFDFEDCEIVIYHAQNNSGIACQCLEIEALLKDSPQAAQEVLFRYEKALGLADCRPSSSSLFDLLVRPYLLQQN